MTLRPRHLLLLLAGAALIVAPLLVRTFLWGYGPWGYSRRAYTPPDVPAASMAATPVPTITPVAVSTRPPAAEHELRPAPVVVDLAHMNRLNRSSFQPLAAALAAHDLGLRFWLPDAKIDLFEIQDFTDFPDQSEALAEQLADASALVVVSPYFLWTSAEIALVERFVADGGRLLLISDPDIVGDVARDINNLASPFGGVFNDDYLYDTVSNDRNFTHVFQSDFLAEAAHLAGSTVALYGARSIDGAVEPQVKSAETTLSSVRIGLSAFTTVALTAGEEEDGPRVLLMSDFDVLTEPYADRFDNRDLLDFVGDFLAGSELVQTIDDFPDPLGRDVALVFDGGARIDAAAMMQSAKLQGRLQESGRTLVLEGAALLTSTAALEAPAVRRDLIYVVDYVGAETALLDELGIGLVEEIETPEPAPAVSPTFEPISILPAETAESPFSAAVAATQTVTQTVTPTERTPTVTSTATATSTPIPTPTATPTPQVTLLLVTDSGLRLLADETVLLAQEELPDQTRMVAVLGSGQSALMAGIDRLIESDFEGCILEPTLALCPFEPDRGEDVAPPAGEEPSEEPSEEPTTEPTTAPPVSATAVVTPGIPPPKPNGAAHKILIVDDNDSAAEGEVSEADAYLKMLTQMGYTPTLWVTGNDGTPMPEQLVTFDWVIWSGAGYAISGPGVQDLNLIFEYLNGGGRLTISSRNPFFGYTGQPATSIVDVAVDTGVPALVEGLPEAPIVLEPSSPPVSPLDNAVEDGETPEVALRRGPQSEDGEAPLLFTLTDEEGTEASGARMLVLGMSITWLPDEAGSQLVRNMAGWMLTDLNSSE